MTGIKHAQSSLKSLKLKNRHDVLELLRNSAQPLTVADIAGRTRLSKMTVHKILEHHVENGLAVVAGKGAASEDGGKRPGLFTFNPNYRFIFSVKIASVSMTAAITNLNAEILISQSVSFDPETRLGQILRILRTLFATLSRKLSLRDEDCVGVVVGCHGITDSESGVIVTSPHFSSWGSNIPIRDRVRELFPFHPPVYVDNWSRYHAYGEMKSGDLSSNSFILIGTEYEGIAAGLVMDGRLTRGARSLSGEIGHMLVDPGCSEVCVCGGIGCLEVAMSLRRMEDNAWSRRSDWPDSLLFQGGRQKKPSFDRIFEASNANDAFACILMDDAVRRLAVAVNNITQVCDPGLVIIQGEYARAGGYFLGQLRERLKGMSLLRMDKRIRVEYSRRGVEWTLFGAAHYAADIYFSGIRAH